MPVMHDHRKVVAGDHGRLPRTFLQLLDTTHIWHSNTGWNTLVDDTYPTMEFATIYLDYEVRCNVERFGHNKSYQKQVTIKGNSYLEGTFEGIWDATVNYFDGLGDNSYINTRKYYYFRSFVNSASGTLDSEDSANGPSLIAYIGIDNIRITCPTKGSLKYKFNFSNVGSFMLPGDYSSDDSTIDMGETTTPEE